MGQPGPPSNHRQLLGGSEKVSPLAEATNLLAMSSRRPDNCTRPALGLPRRPRQVAAPLRVLRVVPPQPLLL